MLICSSRHTIFHNLYFTKYAMNFWYFAIKVNSMPGSGRRAQRFDLSMETILYNGMRRNGEQSTGKRRLRKIDKTAVTNGPSKLTVTESPWLNIHRKKARSRGLLKSQKPKNFGKFAHRQALRFPRSQSFTLIY